MDAPLVLPSSLQCRLFQASLQCKRWETLTKSQVLSVFFLVDQVTKFWEFILRDGGDNMDQIPKGGMTPQGCHHRELKLGASAQSEFVSLHSKNNFHQYKIKIF